MKNSEDEQKRLIYPVTDGIASHETRKKYAYHFKRFIEHFDGITEQSLLQKDVRVIEAMVIQWIKHLSESQHQRRSTIHREVAAVLHFFDWNDVCLNKRKINRSIPEDEEVRQDRAYSHEEIRQMLTQCDERGRVIILVMSSSGMRLGALPGLRFKDITHIPDYNLYRIQVYARSKDTYYTFCTPECKKAIDEYVTFREVHGEAMSEDSPLVRELFDTRVRFAAARSRPMKIQGLETLMHRMLKRAEVKSADVMRSHGLRKFFVSQCIKAGLDYNAREYLVGHKHSRGLDVHYGRTTEEDRVKEYAKAIPLLIIDPKQRLQTRVNELESERSQEISALLQKDAMNTDAISVLSDKLQVAIAEIEKLKNRE